MISSPRSDSLKPGFTLIELTVVIVVLLSLMQTGFFVSRKINEWKLGRDAAETLRTVYTAQRLYLADNPTVSVNSLTATLLIPYLPNQATTIPTVKSLTGADLPIIVNVYPPVVNDGSGVAYDPSGNSKDSLWDVGE
jgi:prepilin-type N-terminal cleavage/methylation domain-containing protein